MTPALLTHTEWLAAGSPPDVDRLAPGLELRRCWACARAFSRNMGSEGIACPTCRTNDPNAHRYDECEHEDGRRFVLGSPPGVDRMPDGREVTVYSAVTPNVGVHIRTTDADMPDDGARPEYRRRYASSGRGQVGWFLWEPSQDAPTESSAVLLLCGGGG